MGLARNNAVARQNAEIEASQQRAIAARVAEQKPRSALESMASRLQVSPANLQNTLRSTVFSACRSNEEFVALVITCNEYGLNPLLKEIYAFPAKGGGIVPMVSVDGWIRLMNTHPQFDGIEFDYHEDEDGQIEAIESIIHRKDRNHPIKTIEYMAECKGDTIPWKKSPRRMLRHRALIQGVRIAFGFSGIVSEDEVDAIDGGDLRPVSLPSSQSMGEYLDDEIPAFKQDGQVDADTGEVMDRDPQTGMTEVSEETARQLDAEGQGYGDDHQDDAGGDEESPAVKYLNAMPGKIAAAKSLKGLQAVDADWVNNRVAYDDADAARIDGLIATRRRELNSKQEG